jgi:putative DNA primase/helicase
MEKKEEARYLQDKATLDSYNQIDYTITDLNLLNVLPDNYKRWRELKERQDFTSKVKQQIMFWAESWESERGEVLAQLKQFAKEQDVYTETELKDWLNEEVKKIKKKQVEENDEDIEIEEGSLKEYLELVKDKKFSEASELLVNIILTSFNIYTTKDDVKTEVWIYKDGIYVPQGKSEIKEFLRNYLGKFYSQFVFNLVMNKLEPDTFIDIDTFFNQNYIREVPVLNGILDLKTRELKPFTPKKIFFSKLKVSYDANAVCPMIDKFLSEVLADKEDNLVFYEMGGFCLLKEYKFEKAFIFVGDGRNGKDKSIELLKRIFGLENVCSVPLSSLVAESFVISEFFGKMINMSGEINNKDLKDTSMFKALTGRSIISGQRKYLKPIVFQNYAKFIFACNELPMVYDNSRGFWDRWVLLEFPYTFLPGQELEVTLDKTKKKLRDEDIIEKISTPEEMSGLLNNFLDGLDNLLKNRRFSSTIGCDEIKTHWVRKANSFMAFCMDSIEEQYDGMLTKKEIRKRYMEYNKKHKAEINKKRRAKAYEQSRSGLASKTP